MDETTQRSTHGALRRILRALARLLLRHGVSYEDFAALAKQCYVEVAQAEFSLSPRPASKSRIALLTGLNRREVARVLAEPAALDAQASNPCARVVAAWVREPAFRTSDGRPSLLPLEGPAPSFEALVRAYANDIPPMPVLRELRHLDLVAERADGRLELLAEGYIPRAGAAAKLGLLGTDVAALIDTIDHNLARPQAPRFQRKVSFDHLSPAGVHKLQAFVAERGQDWLLALDRELAPEDRAEGGRFAGAGLYVFDQPPPGGSDHADD